MNYKELSALTRRIRKQKLSGELKQLPIVGTGSSASKPNMAISAVEPFWMKTGL